MKPIDKLLSIMKTLRDPEKGCPWDIKQTPGSIAPHTLEEVYELLDAIENKDMNNLCDELGDLLFHVVFYSEMADEAGYFNFDKVAKQVATKLQRRHPHVFADNQLDKSDGRALDWEDIKQQERDDRAKATGVQNSLLDNIASAMPAVMRAEKLQKRAATVGFDWPDLEPVLAKIDEELAELRVEIQTGAGMEKLRDELGDLLFSCVNLARHIRVEPERALDQTNRKFESRFRFVEKRLREQGVSLKEASLEQMDALWREAKMLE